MWDCCPFCYEKYLNTDGSVDWDPILEIAVARGDKELPDEEDLCKCPCHVKGAAVFH